jgi:membrane protease YdiL (CAAX protease family)
MGVSENIILSILDRSIIPEQFYLSIGAGIWEELLFRVGATGIIIYFMKYSLRYNQLFSVFIAIFCSAIMFSIFHYVGQLGDIFTFRSFCLRTFAGIMLGALYVFRGFGITAYTHIFYDMAIIGMPVLMYNK